MVKTCNIDVFSASCLKDSMFSVRWEAAPAAEVRTVVASGRGARHGQRR